MFLWFFNFSSKGFYPFNKRLYAKMLYLWQKQSYNEALSHIHLLYLL